MYRCCVFDLDGTLLNTLESLSNSVNAMLKHFELGPVDDAHIKKFVGDGYKKLVERTLAYCRDEELKHYEKALDVYRQEFAVHSMDGVKPYAGIRELLEYLRSADIRMAVLSNKPHEKTVFNIHSVFGEDYFDIVNGEQQGINRKPSPEGLFRILKQLNLKPSECLYVGDTSTDMETGRAAGVDTAGVLWGFRDEAELDSWHPQYLVGEPGEIIGIIKNRLRGSSSLRT